MSRLLLNPDHACDFLPKRCGHFFSLSFGIQQGQTASFAFVLCGLIEAKAGVLDAVTLVDQNFFKKRAIFLQRPQSDSDRTDDPVTDQLAFTIALIFPLGVVADTH